MNMIQTNGSEKVGHRDGSFHLNPVKRPTCSLLATAILRLLPALCICGLATPGSAETRYWTGTAGPQWSNPSNWDPAGTPENGDLLHFEGGLAPITMINDIVNLQVRGLQFFGGTYEVSGNTITLSPGGTGDWALLLYEERCVVTINCSLVLGGQSEVEVYPEVGADSLLRVNADINLNGHALILKSWPVEGGSGIIEMAGSISGVGHVVAISGDLPAKVEFLGTADNTFSGTLSVHKFNPDCEVCSGGVYLNKQAGSVVNDRIEIGKGATLKWRASHQVGNNIAVVVRNGGQMDLDGHTETIGSLSLSNSIGDTEPSLVDTGGATLSVLGNITAINNATNVVPTIRGKLGLPGVGADAKTKTTLTSTSPQQRTVSGTSRASASNRSQVNQQTQGTR
jgi:hypothetical protein